MPEPNRTFNREFQEDVFRILGDPDGVLRAPPSQVECAYGYSLHVMLVGEGDVPPGPLNGIEAGQFHAGSEVPYMIKYSDWGNCEWGPFGPAIPACRIWYLEIGDDEHLIAMLNVEGMPGGEFVELGTIVAGRLQQDFGSGEVRPI